MRIDTSMEFNYDRTARLIREVVSSIDLDLSGLTVYTEAATGGYGATAAIAVAGDADSVYAITKDSSYGSASEATSHTERLAGLVGENRRIEFTTERRRTHLHDADIVTNTGFVRPINARIVGWLSSDTAVPLMYEPWEFRDSDMDIEALWAAGVPVLGTDESDPRVSTQRYLRALSARLVLECGTEIYNGQFVVLGDGLMAQSAAEGLGALGGSVERLSPTRADAGDALVTLGEDVLDDLDALVVVDHETDRLLVGDSGMVDPRKLADKTCGVTVVHICGPIATNDLDESGIRYIPERPAPAGTMSYTTGYLGPRPVVDLHAAGLSVGADLVREQRTGADFREATERVAASPLAKDFDPEFKRQHGYFD